MAPSDDARRERFTRLVGLVHEPLRRYAARRVDAADVDDVVADTLLVLWRRLDEVPAEAELPWAYACARGCVANTRRSAVRRDRLVTRLAAEPVFGDPDGTDRTDDVGAALDALPEREREVVLLWAWEGLAPREIAVVLGTSANAVSLRLTRARRRLRWSLGARQDRPPAGQERVTGKEG